MMTVEKLKILTEGAKYDVSCSSSGSSRNNCGGIGNASFGGICHSFTEDGRCISLLKMLMSNNCVRLFVLREQAFKRHSSGDEYAEGDL